MKRMLLGLLVGATAASVALNASVAAAQGTRVESRSFVARYSTISHGDQVIPAGQTVSGSVLVVNGRLDVYGDIAGAATTFRGDLVVHEGGRVRGSAVAVMGRVRNEGGSILGMVKEAGIRHNSTAISFGGRPPSTLRSLRAALLWLVVLLALGMWALFFAGEHLRKVVHAIAHEMPRSLVTGVAGGLAAFPLVIAIAVVLAVTIIGIIFIPVGIGAFLLALAGAAMFGFLAVAQVTGMAIAGSSAATETPAGNELRYLVSGILAYSTLWIVAALFTWVPVVGALLRVLAASVTLVAVLTGFGAVILSWWRARSALRASAA